MTQEDRIVKMTKAALYEQKEKNRSLHRLRFYKRDYVTLHVLIAWGGMSVAFGLGFVIWVLCQVETSGQNRLSEWICFGIAALVAYVTMSIVYALIARNLYSSRYEEAEASSKKYAEYLMQLKE